jgi:hypothetical protein
LLLSEDVSKKWLRENSTAACDIDRFQNLTEGKKLRITSNNNEQNREHAEAMNRKLLLTVMALMALGLSGIAYAAPYGYEFDDPYVATVVGTSGQDMYRPRDNVRPWTHTLRMDDRIVPDLFWHSETLRYSAALQSQKAPLVFLIAGTGAGYNSQKNAFLQQVFYDAGYHAISIPSPTHPNFIVSASTSRAPGYIRDDVKDLYVVFERVMEDLNIEEDVEGYYISGYSLGGAQAAFLARLDDERGRFGFKRVLMLNPPVSLYDSALRLDALLRSGGRLTERAEETVSRMVKIVSEYYTSQEKVDFSGDFLYRLYNFGGDQLQEYDLETLIGVSFRMSSSNIIFASDVCLGSGYIVPHGVQLEPADPLLEYLQTCMKLSFEDYFEEFLAPYMVHRNPALTREELIRKSSLKSIQQYLAQDERIFMVTNVNDPILSSQDVTFLRETFGKRGYVYPRGGHCGNIMYRENVEDMLRIMKDGEVGR